MHRIATTNSIIWKIREVISAASSSARAEQRILRIVVQEILSIISRTLGILTSIKERIGFVLTGKLDVHEAARLQEIREKNELNRIRQEQKAAKDKEYATWYDGLTPLMKSLANLDRLLSRPRLD